MNDGLFPKPKLYVPPVFRQTGKEHEAPVGTVKQSDLIVNSPMNNLEPAQRNKVPFPERLEKNKEDKQFTKFLEIMKEVQVTIPVLDAVLHANVCEILQRPLDKEEEH